MNISVAGHRPLHIFIVTLLIAIMPPVTGWYFAFVLLLFKVFVIACVIDFITRGNYRKKLGYVLAPMIASCIAAFIITYLIF
jgi:hypothetical protein